MSERSDCFGAKAPPHVIEHAGRRYEVAAAITEGVMTAIENQLYARARAALREAKDDYTRDEYLAELEKLRKRYERGDYSFESPEVTELLKTPKGAMLLLSAMTGAPAPELMALLVAHGPELNALLEQAMNASFPETAAPKAKAGQ